MLDPNGARCRISRTWARFRAAPDVFIEVAAMRAAADTTYGSAAFPLKTSLPSVTDEFGHNHMPTPAVLQMLG